MAKKPREIADVLSEQKTDRRLLSHVPDATGARSASDRRDVGGPGPAEGDFRAFIQSKLAGQRYEVDYKVKVGYLPPGARRPLTMEGRGQDLSTTGMLLQLAPGQAETLHQATGIRLWFEIEPGTMPEGYEMRVRGLRAECARAAEGDDGHSYAGLRFTTTLSQYATRGQGFYMLTMASIFLFAVTLVIVLMRAESVVYFRFNRYLYFYSIVVAVFLLSRYLFAIFYRPVPIDPGYAPGVTVIIPCFNEERWIQRTIRSCMDQDYPPDRLEVIVVDDCSSDNSVRMIEEEIGRLKAQGERYKVEGRLSLWRQPVNMGKRDAMAAGAKLAQHELLVFVDSDSFLDPFAVRNVVQPFRDAKMGGVCGRTDVANTYTNALTKMQSVRYYVAFRVMKAAEGYFDAVTCLSGPLSCYRRDLVRRYSDAWIHQTFLGKRATFGDDRAMTNFILRHHRTTYQDTAVCSTIVPNDHKMFRKQQMRWKRSWLRESLIAGGYMWRKEPFISLLFYMGLCVPIIAPVIVLYNLVFVPLAHRVFPVTFLVGMLMMSLLMSFAQLFLRRSSTWIYGLWFCVYYECVLLWQMPVAWFTFWYSTWGTRLTPADLEEQRKKAEKAAAKAQAKAARAAAGGAENAG